MASILFFLTTLGPTGSIGAISISGPHATLIALLGTCNSDAHLDGADLSVFVTCLTTGGSGCNCWDLNDNGTVDLPDIGHLVSTLLGDLPYALNDRYTGPLNTPIVGNVRTNDLDPHGPGTTVALVTGPPTGVLNLAPNGAMTYTPVANLSGQVTFTYRAVNAYGVSAPATVFLATCSATTADCNGNPRDGCETSLTSLANCGACGVPCFLTNATVTCATGSCLISACNPGYSNCDGIQGNGCEVAHATYSNSCASAEYVGQDCGDVTSGVFCTTTTSFHAFNSRTGNIGRWFRATAEDCSSCLGSIQARITLYVPPGSDYDLYAYSTCGNVWSSSTNGGSATEQVLLSRSDTGADDSYLYWIEIRWFAGASCSDWSLTFEGRD